MVDWKIHRRDEACARCDREFADGEPHFSILLLTEEALGREDRCVPCFEASEDVTVDDVFWRTRRRVKAKTGISVDFDSVERLFHALDGREEPRLAELRYLLSLLLMRKKKLKLVRVKRAADGEWMIVRRPRRTEALGVRVFDLTAERAEELRGELERIIEGAGAEDLLEMPPAGATDADEGGEDARANVEPAADDADAVDAVDGEPGDDAEPADRTNSEPETAQA